MKLHEKIAYYRKRAGLSQEALAEKLGVSRQAVSKWETGDSQPELSNLLAMARAFGVTADHLISDEDAPAEEKSEMPSDAPSKEKIAVKALGITSRLIKRYGWLAGVYAAVSGVPFLIVGLVMRAIAKSSEAIMGSFGGAVNVTVDEFGNAAVHSAGSVFSDPAVIISYAVLGIGAALIIGGIILAVYLRKKLH